MGASILIVPVGAASDKARSLSRAVIFESFVPSATSKAYCVTAGPKFTSMTLAAMPKDSSVCSIVAALFLISPRSALPPLVSEKIVICGYFQTFSSPGILVIIFCVSGAGLNISTFPVSFSNFQY